ncbi:MAG: glucuronate isomerase [Streptococcaceae bacterium]|jgi:glucuronate isomerase|nr:glucuronate isomerase [Streptococcaceae bacterium]
MKLLSEDFLLKTEVAKTLFHNYAKEMPIIDFHCHLNPVEIYENKNYTNITRIWLNEGSYGDHYKWRLMRANGVPEELITGDGDDYEKFLAWAGTIEKALGNPLYEWSHLELKRFFHIDEVFNRQTAPAIWEKANKLLQTDDFKPRSLIRNSNVKAVCTTDDPASDLHFHVEIARDEAENGFKVLPALRPDKLLHIQNDEFGDYLEELGTISGVKIHNLSDIVKAMHQRFEFFTSMGGALSDHSLETFYYEEADTVVIDGIIAKGIQNSSLTALEINQYLTAIMIELMKLNNEFDWTMQFHINSTRNVNRPMFKKIGADTGYDMMGTQADIVDSMQKLYSAAADGNFIPKTIFYSLNQNDWLQLATLMQSFQGNGVQRLQLGAGWWFNDTAEYMHKQLEVFAQQSLLPNFVGMLTDSRSFLSYPRHEYFRRVLCNFFGELVEQGRVEDNVEMLGKLIQNISYNNAHDYFGFFK